ncbi:MAG: prepilin-type N-terminal cleavage/methylation domain-containing protein [Sedimentisphaerales bacterium]|nr:prepilin-type N-terminal cleavage/methylation domain-containing protein [Sedimentisphaerales bacterium]
MEAGIETEKRGFTLMEIFIVVIILCITSAVVVPQFSRASQQARLSEMLSDLQKVRSQLELYKIQHDDLLPGQAEQGGAVDAEQFVAGLTSKDEDGFGPYLKRIPRNVFNGLDTIQFVNDPEAEPCCQVNTGWWLNGATGEFRANDCTQNSLY